MASNLLRLGIAVLALSLPLSTSGREAVHYNPGSVETVDGEILAVDTADHSQDLRIRTDQETLLVQVGLRDYIQGEGIRFEPGQRITVTGSRVTFQGAPLVIAREIRTETRTLRLRNTNGYPIWE